MLLMLLHGMQVRGPARDLHSGNDGGVFNEPLADLTKVCHRVHSEQQARYASPALTDANARKESCLTSVHTRTAALELIMPPIAIRRKCAQIKPAFLPTQRPA